MEASLYVLFNVWSNLEILPSFTILLKIELEKKNCTRTIILKSDVAHDPLVSFIFPPNQICPAFSSSVYTHKNV